MLYLRFAFESIKRFAVMLPTRTLTKAVAFDMGGVVIPFPAKTFTDYESKIGVPKGTLLKTIKASHDDSAWCKLERGELDLDSFAEEFNLECLKLTGFKVDAKDLLYEMDKSYSEPFPVMINAVKKLRHHGLKTALLTNNFQTVSNEIFMPLDRSLFDVIIESARVKMRKPERRIYEKLINDLQVLPSEIVFLDDLGHNLKVAREMGIHTIKVESPEQAVRDLEKFLSMKLSDCYDGTEDVPDRLKIDADKLELYLKNELGLDSPDKPSIKCFVHGQSNPTYLIDYAGNRLVLRKKPPGTLLPTAHAIDREYKVMKALQNTEVPVPKMISFCSDDSILGTPFFLMEFVDGLIIKDPNMIGFSAEQKRKVLENVCDVLYKIHQVDYDEVGLGNFGGKSGSFLSRNLSRWWKQHESSKIGSSLNDMSSLHAWLVDRLPSDEKTCLVHGDYKLDNLVFDPVTFEVKAVIDWELSTLGDPMTDLTNSCLMFVTPKNDAGFPSLSDEAKHTMPSLEEFVKFYFKFSSMDKIPENWDFYFVFLHFKAAAILEGVYKRFLNNQASSANAKFMLTLAETMCDNGWTIAQNSPMPPTNNNNNNNNADDVDQEGTAKNKIQFGLMATCVEALEGRAQSTVLKVKDFVDKFVIPMEDDLASWHSDPETKWTIHPKIEELKTLAKSEGLWNLFVPRSMDPNVRYGKGFTNVEYSFMAEEMGRSPFAAEVFNCSAPDTGNMEVLMKYGSDEQKEKWLKPLLDGRIRSCFAMTEPGVASSDATNITASIRKDGNEYVINGRKWWTSGAMDPRCSVSILMGKTDEHGKPHLQQSMVIVPMDSNGVKIVRPLHVFGFDDAPHGHAEVLFENVRVPESNLLLGEGRGFEIAQGRLGPGRIHHCMRLLGGVERCLQLMLERTHKRIAFGKPLIEHGTVQRDVAEARIKIEQARLLVLKTAHIIDMAGSKAAALEIAMIKAVVPEMSCDIIDRAIQSFGGMGVCQDVILSYMYTFARSLCIADGPTEVHLRSVARMEMKKYNSRL